MTGPFDLLRDTARELRRVPMVRQVFERTDPARRAHRISQSGLLDLDLYRAQLDDADLSAARAVEHYVRWGHWAGTFVHPLIDDATLRAGLVPSERPPVFDYLWRRAWHLPVSPWWSAAEYLAEHPEAREHPAGPVGHLMDRIDRDPRTPVVVRMRGEVRQVTWREWRAGFVGALAPWAEMDALRRKRRLGTRFEGVETLGDWSGDADAPLVSIVLATWNRAGELRAAVESVLAQSWQNWELLIVDDGSWDDTAIICELLADRDPRIRFIARPHEGVSAARNAGTAMARGDFVTFIDSDNTWLPRFVEEMMIAMRGDHARAAFATLQTHDANGTLFRQAEVDRELLAIGNMIDLNTLVIRRDVLEEVGGFDPALKRAVDYDLILRIAAVADIHHVPVIGAVYDNSETRSDRISTSQPLGWNTAVRVKNLFDLDTPLEGVLEPGVDFVVFLHGRDPRVDDKLAEAAALAEDPRHRVRIFFIVPSPGDWMRGTLATAEHPRLHIELATGPETYSYMVAAALSGARHDRTVFVESAVGFDAASLARLAEIVEPGVQRAVAPLIVRPDGTLVTAGAAFPRSGVAPVDLLSRHPLDDAHALGPLVSVPALSGQTFAIPTRDLLSVGGLDPLLYNEYELPALSIALKRRVPSYETVVATDVSLPRLALEEDFARLDPQGSENVIRATTQEWTADRGDAVYAELGMRVSHYRDVASQPVLVSTESTPDESDEPFATIALPARHRLQPVVVRDRRSVEVGGQVIPRLRWALRIASPAGAEGEVWGDTHFARALGRALRTLGQDVVIDHHDVDHRPTAYLDDVTLVLRGLDAVTPLTAGVSLLWIISHPDDVTGKEAAGFDRVFAASAHWSDRATEHWGLKVEPLLQCTDPELFTPSGLEPSGEPVFVGKSRGVPRVAAVAPVQAGVPVRIFGPEWGGILPPGTVEAEYFPNAELARLYESAPVVLNDHWSDMRRDGFISNRLFDVVAAGGRVLSDEVDGLDGLFGRSVRTFADGDDLVAQLRDPALVDSFGSREEQARTSARIREEHSFLARARVLLDAALAEHRSRRAPG